MISIRNNGTGFDFVIGPHVIPLTREEAVHLLEMFWSEDWRSAAYGPWRLEEAGAFDHPWEKRSRAILCHGERRWHLTEEEVDLLAELIQEQLRQ
jgi:hypothetical protein